MFDCTSWRARGLPFKLSADFTEEGGVVYAKLTGAKGLVIKLR